ncbi:MAG: chemotaxis protein CheB [Aliarcobacter sp.]|nr:chemotaxis protein CheB [Aliarcobacter sp.]
MKHNKTVLYIEDDNEIRNEYTNFFKKYFTTVITASNGREGLSKFITHHPDLIITDIKMPDINGPELIHSIRNTDKKTPIIVLSEYANEPFLTESFNNIISGHILKPADHKKLLLLINSILLKKDNKDEIQIEKEEIEEDKKKPYFNINNNDLMVVGIGASAGGLEALSALVAGLPKNNNTAYVLAQHLSPTHKTMLVDLLSRETTLHVKDAIDGEVLSSDILYITPPNKNIEINEKNEIVLSTPEKYSFLPKPSVNQLFISIAEQKKDKAVGIILSGTGSDGAQGMRAINAEGGITIVQEPTSAKYDGMPMAALNCI